jgi:hypothetical protein
MKIRPVGAQLFCAKGETDRYTDRKIDRQIDWLTDWLTD